MTQTDLTLPKWNAAVTQPSSAVKAAAAESLGKLPLLSMISGVALLLIAFATNAARNNMWIAEWLFWAAILVLFVPTLSRLLSYNVARHERIGLVLMVAFSFYILKLLHSPVQFTFFDEFLHWRTAIDIQRTQHLFAENSVLPVSALFPGLEIVTTAFANLSGLSVFDAGLIVIGIGRLLFMLALLLFFERVSKSIRFASLAAMLYMANSNFVFFDAQFAYESLALPMAMFILLAVVARQQNSDRWIQLPLGLIVVGIAALAITHHLTMYALTGLLWLWVAWAFFRHHDRWQVLQLVIVALIALVASVVWAQVAGNAPIGYLTPVLQGGVSDLIGIIKNELASRELFQSATGYSAPLWERLVGFGAVAFICLGLPFGLYQVWKRCRHNALALALACLVVLYPVSLVFRLTARGWEISSRTSEFLFISLSFVLAAAGLWFMMSDRFDERRKLLVAAWATVIFAGGIIAGWPPWARLPGQFLVSADTRSVSPQGIAAAKWTKQHLGTDNRIGTDRMNRVLTLTYGEQRPVTTLEDGVDIGPVMYSKTITSAERNILTNLNVRYLLVDLRLSTALPSVGVYFENDNPKTPISADSLRKFDGMADVNRIFDSGDIAIYDVSKLHVAR